MDYHKHIEFVENVDKSHFVWFEEDWVYEEVLHSHIKGQLIYVESGFQYLTVDGNMYLLPQNYAAWVPANTIHKTNSHSEKIRMMIMFSITPSEDCFYDKLKIFTVPTVLKEMINYAEKWSKKREYDNNEHLFLQALFNELPQFAKDSMQLCMPLPDDARLKDALNHLHACYMEDVDIEDLSDLANLSTRSLERIFKKETGLTLRKYQQMLRITKSLELLSSNEMTISEIAFTVGYKSLQAYTNSFYSLMKYRPSEFYGYRKL